MALSHDNRLADYLRRTANKPFAWGSCDCCLFVADWVSETTGKDMAVDLRGTYETEAGAKEIIARASQTIRARGDMIGFCVSRAAAIGLVGTKSPADGDIGVVDTAMGLICAIRGTRNWIVKSQRGIVSAPFEWRLAFRV